MVWLVGTDAHLQRQTANSCVMQNELSLVPFFKTEEKKRDLNH